MKNMAIIGGLLQAYLLGAGKWSLDFLISGDTKGEAGRL